jgi:hypothetical protein
MATARGRPVASLGIGRRPLYDFPMFSKPMASGDFIAELGQ